MEIAVESSNETPSQPLSLYSMNSSLKEKVAGTALEGTTQPSVLFCHRTGVSASNQRQPYISSPFLVQKFPQSMDILEVKGSGAVALTEPRLVETGIKTPKISTMDNTTHVHAPCGSMFETAAEKISKAIQAKPSSLVKPLSVTEIQHHLHCIPSSSTCCEIANTDLSPTGTQLCKQSERADSLFAPIHLRALRDPPEEMFSSPSYNSGTRIEDTSCSCFFLSLFLPVSFLARISEWLRKRRARKKHNERKAHRKETSVDPKRRKSSVKKIRHEIALAQAIPCQDGTIRADFRSALVLSKKHSGDDTLSPTIVLPHMVSSTNAVTLTTSNTSDWSSRESSLKSIGMWAGYEKGLGASYATDDSPSASQASLNMNIHPCALNAASGLTLIETPNSHLEMLTNCNSSGLTPIVLEAVNQSSVAGSSDLSPPTNLSGVMPLIHPEALLFRSVRQWVDSVTIHIGQKN